MVDELKQVSRLLVKLEENLPIAASLTPQAAAALKEQSSGADVPRECRVTGVHYLGDEGGVVAGSIVAPRTAEAKSLPRSAI